jgi:hypothetical protein
MCCPGAKLYTENVSISDLGTYAAGRNTSVQFSWFEFELSNPMLFVEKPELGKNDSVDGDDVQLIGPIETEP